MPTALTISKAEGKPGEVYHPLQITHPPVLSPKPGEVVVRMRTAALNHRDLFIRQSLYPKTAFGVPLLADGCGVVTSTGSNPSSRAWAGKRVVINPGTGWASDPDGPESPGGYRIMGGTSLYQLGTAMTELIVAASELEPAPQHLSDIEAAALPLTGLTAWRATFVKAAKAMAPNRNILITGIGGGVAIMALLFGVAAGANVFVTSGHADKIAKATQLGAKGGVNYKDKDWEKQLSEMTKKISGRAELDAIIDGAGGDIIDKAIRILKTGGVVSQYGMTVSPKMTWNMGAVLRNIELKGSTMGSRKEFADMLRFVNEKGLKPVISKVASGGGLENLKEIEELFQDMKDGNQFGKLVIVIEKGASTTTASASTGSQKKRSRL